MPKTGYIFGDSDTVVHDMLEGMKQTYPGLHIDPENGIVMLNRNRRNRVGLICGAGAGKEPFGAGLVGEGMLTAYACGKVFQTPKVKVIKQLIHNVAMLNKGGILVLLLNYPRQVLNFGLAIERARQKGIMIESFVITDDCARTEEAELIALEKNLILRRGLSGCAYVFKILGTMSSFGCSLWEILDHAMSLNFRLATIGFSMISCTLLGKSEPIYEIPKGEVVVGCGLQGDNGVRNINADSMSKVVKDILPKAVEQSGLKESSCSSCCILVNNLGTMTQIELYFLANEIDIFLGNMGIGIERFYVGTLMTSFNTKGALVSILNCTDVPEWVSYLDACTEAFAWPGSRLSKVNPKWPLKDFNHTIGKPASESGESSETGQGMILTSQEGEVFKKCIESACIALINEEEVINRLNALSGNGDCGTNMRTFGEHMLEAIQDMDCCDVSKTLDKCCAVVNERMPGTIGTLYSMAFFGASTNADCWISCWENAISQIVEFTKIGIGYRTLLDALIPAYEMFVHKIRELGEENWREALDGAVKNAECGCFQTVDMAPKVGKAKYKCGKVKNMDAGAYGVCIWLKAIYTTLIEEIPMVKINVVTESSQTKANASTTAEKSSKPTKKK